ncbi:response regulator [Sulfobacillus acidophilus]|uniref:Stage 0 sporulation protein A homolog n=1 Tax=Sulfobacillus acidophilus TaxID=53633 RepID=A0ABS3AWL5_9FIRM|nr:response regulator [Sulfobacillus acidophilus]
MIEKNSTLILLVDDEEFLMDVSKQIIEGAGYNVLTASSGAEALKVINQNQKNIHLLITDVVMDGMSGQELAKKVLIINPSVKVIYTSGYGHEILENEKNPKENLAFLQKPFAPNDMMKKIHEVLKQ